MVLFIVLCKGGSNFWVCGQNPRVWPFKWNLVRSTFGLLWCSNFWVCVHTCNHRVCPFKRKLLSSTFLWYCLLCCTRWFYFLSLSIKSWSVTIQMQATEQYFPVVLFIMLHKVVLVFEFVDEILKCDHWKESYWAELSVSCGTVYCAAQGGSNFWVCGWNLKVWPFKRELLSWTFGFLWYCLLCCTRWF